MTGHKQQPDGLTERQAEVLQALWDHDGNRDKVADLLCISINTLKTHITCIFGCLGCNSLAELLVVAHKQGLIRQTPSAVYSAEQSAERWKR